MTSGIRTINIGIEGFGLFGKELRQKRSQNKNSDTIPFVVPRLAECYTFFSNVKLKIDQTKVKASLNPLMFWSRLGRSNCISFDLWALLEHSDTFRLLFSN